MSTEQRWDFLRQRIDGSSAANFASFGDGTEEHWIDQAEAKLNIEFPPSYRWWLRMYGGGEVSGIEILSVYRVEAFAGDRDVVRVHLASTEHASYSPDRLTICRMDDELFYLLLSQRDAEGEAPVFFVDEVNDVHYLYARTFAEFLVRLISEQS